MAPRPGVGVDADEITQFLHLIDLRHAATTIEILPHVNLRCGPYATSLVLSEPKRPPSPHTEANTPSLASSATRRSAGVFDAPYGRSVYSASSTAPSLLGPEPLHRQRPPVPFAEPPLHRQLLPCEFAWFTDCEEMFDLDQEEAWVQHMAAHHLLWKFPRYTICWFCDDAEFRAKSSALRDRKVAYTQRICHVAEHFRLGRTISDVRADFFFLDHIYDHGLINEILFQRAKDYHEVPQPKNGINTQPYQKNQHRGQEIWVVESPQARRRRGEPEQRSRFQRTRL